MSLETSTAIVARRAIESRRSFTWRTIVYGFMWSRRRNLRREEDAEVLFLDWHHPWLFFLAVGMMLLSCIDAFMTLQLIERGMYEANPLMSALLGHGATAFIITKMALTAVGILTLVFLSNVQFLNRLRTGLFLTLFFSLYACLVCYEFVYLLASMQ